MRCPNCDTKCKRRRIGVFAGGRSHMIRTKFCKKCDIHWRKYVGRWSEL